MSDQTSDPVPANPTTASQDVGVAATPGPLTFEQATALRSELMTKPGFAQRWINGEISARQEFAAITAALAKGAAPDPAKEARRISVAGKSLMNEFQKSEFVDQIPVPRAIYDEARQLRDDLVKDPQFYQKWRSFDRDARKKLSLLSQILSRPIGD